jgi:hypothetical protein
MTSQNMARDFWTDKNVTDNQVLFELYHELALLIIPCKGYSQLLANADLSDQDRRRMGTALLENTEILESLKEALDVYLEQFRKLLDANMPQSG